MINDLMKYLDYQRVGSLTLIARHSPFRQFSTYTRTHALENHNFFREKRKTGRYGKEEILKYYFN